MTRAAKVLTVSDGVASGHRDDTGGRGLVAHLGDHGFEIVEHLRSERIITEVLQQAGVAMLSQANALPNLALRLLS